MFWFGSETSLKTEETSTLTLTLATKYTEQSTLAHDFRADEKKRKMIIPLLLNPAPPCNQNRA